MKSSATNCVTCTTVHASKGLEYPVVIYIEAHGNSSRPQTLSVQSGIILHNSSQKKRGQKMQEILDIKKEKDKAEDERLNYVAISRSAFGFCCIASFAHSESVESFFFMLQNSLKKLPSNTIEQSTDGFFTKMTYERSSNLKNVEDLPQTQVEVLKFENAEIQHSLNKSDEASIGEKFGTLVHALFEKSHNNLEFEDFLQFYEVSESFGVEFEELFTELKHKVQSIDTILQEQFQPIEIRKEHEIIFNGKILRIDALYFCKNEIVIIDYKTQNPLLTNEIQLQLENYISAISQIYKVNVRAFVVWFVKFPQAQILQQVELRELLRV
jgi:ATP-dependent exoDNAse (exonuclease V) beta subunit